MNRGMVLSGGRHVVTVAVAALALALTSLAVVGGVRAYSPVPFWDMWNGYLDFFMHVAEGNQSVWWIQHNEHRIIWSRILFWMDIKWFGGGSWFLIAVNYALICVGALVFGLAMRERAGLEEGKRDKLAPSLFVMAWLFLWMQYENLTWAFQSQFILAQLLPLCALYWLHKSTGGNRRIRDFGIAAALGVASAGAMANGILALPLMTTYALVTRQRPLRAGILAMLSGVTLLWYFHGYHAPDHHGSLTRALADNPSGVLRFVLLYVGSPFYYLFGEGKTGKVAAYLGSLALVGSAAWFAIQSLRQPRHATLPLALLVFILYVGGTALGTAGGRLIFGLDQALSSRYTTPALMAWAALLALFVPALSMLARKRPEVIWLPFGALATLMVQHQAKALNGMDNTPFERNIAGLALELNIRDQLQIAHIFPSAEIALKLADKPAAQDLSIFGMFPYQGVKELIGQAVAPRHLPVCQGALDRIEAIDGEKRFVRVRGWMFNPAEKSYPQVVRFLDDQGKIVGYALSGGKRPDVARAINKKALNSGYGGYVLAGQAGAVLKLQGENRAGPSCQMQGVIAAMPIQVAANKP